MDYVSVLLPLALIMLVCKLFAIFCKDIGLPQVIGYLVGGILLGLVKLIPSQQIFTAVSLEGIGFIAKIGVILIMFSAGLEADINKIKVTGLKSVIITFSGVILPLVLGFLTAVMFNGGFSLLHENLTTNLFYGVILTATSVSVTVATLKELGQLSGDMGTCVVSAAILDDIIGVIMLALFIGFSGNKDGLFIVIGKTVLFFLLAMFVGFPMRKVFRYLAVKYNHHVRVSIFAISLCFFYAWVAEKVFGVADITGAFVAGLLLSLNADRDYIDKKTDAISTLIFAPVFFAHIGLNLSLSGFSGSIIGFGICFVAAGLLGKFFGCGVSARLCGFSKRDSFRIGVGTMVRAEVALICVQKGIDNGIINASITPFVVILILVSSLIAPMLLKYSYKKDKAH